MKKSNKTPLAFAVGTALLGGLTSTSLQADTLFDANSNPFSLTELSSGYMQTAEANKSEGSTKMSDGACGEGKCGAAMMGGNEEKTSEGKCAGNKPMPKAKTSEVKCGEGKCGAGMMDGQ